MKQNITVRLSQRDQPGIELLEILEGLLPVAFERSEWGGNNDPGMVVFETARRSSTNGGGTEKLKLTLPKGAINPTSISLTETPVAFSDAPAAPFPFRGTKLKVKLPSEVPALSPMAGETVLASTPGGPIWAASTDKGFRHIRSSLPLPSLAADGMLQQVLNADRFLELLPLLEFLHEICGDNQFARPPLRACFMFDDPNLHWPRYGFVDFKDIAARAARGNYHVSFATVPMDGWFTHPGTARLFQSNPEQLSLLVHGNNHVHDELARDNAPEQRVALLRQAIQRIERLERVTGCEISRVMAAPHGACSDDMLQEMPKCGFESAAISHGSLRAHNKGKPWTRSLGYLPSEIIRDCPVLPRWGMTGNTDNTILLAAYLGQPMILRGHHADLRNGAELLDKLGGVINGLGRVRWGNMTELSRMNYQFRLDQETVRIKPGGVKLDLSLPRGARRLVIEAHASSAWNHWLCTGMGSETRKVNVGEAIPVPDGCERISLTAIITPAVSLRNGDNGLPLWPFLRRLLTEGRDRLQSVSR